MVRLTLLLYSFISSTLAGILIIAVLAAGYGTQMPIIYAAIVGFVVAYRPLFVYRSSHVKT